MRVPEDLSSPAAQLSFPPPLWAFPPPIHPETAATQTLPEHPFYHVLPAHGWWLPSACGRKCKLLPPEFLSQLWGPFHPAVSPPPPRGPELSWIPPHPPPLSLHVPTSPFCLRPWSEYLCPDSDVGCTPQCDCGHFTYAAGTPSSYGTKSYLSRLVVWTVYKEVCKSEAHAWPFGRTRRMLVSFLFPASASHQQAHTVLMPGQLQISAIIT